MKIQRGTGLLNYKPEQTFSPLSRICHSILSQHQEEKRRPCENEGACTETGGYPQTSVLTFYLFKTGSLTVLLLHKPSELAYERLCLLLSLPSIFLQEHWDYMLPGLALLGFWGFELRTSYLQGKCFTH